MNSTAIDADTPYTAGWIENLKPELTNFQDIKEKLRIHYNRITTTEMDETQKRQLEEMTEPIQFDIRYGIIKVGPRDRPLIHHAPVIVCARPQRGLLTKILSKIPRHSFGNGVGVIAVDMQNLMHDEYYEAIVSRSIESTSQQVGIPLIGVHPSLFDESYDPVETEASIALPIREFLLRQGVREIQKTKETDTHGKYLLVTQSDVKEEV